MKSVVIDTSVIIRLLLSNNSYSFLAFENIIKQGYDFYYSNDTLDELKRVLEKKIFKKIPQEERDNFLNSYISRGQFINVEKQIVACRDKNDDMWLDIAYTLRMDYILTYDEDLLILNPFKAGSIDIPIISPEQYLEIEG